MAVFYEVTVKDATEGSVAAPTLKDALDIRKDCEGPYGEITKVTTRPMKLRELLAAVYNREGFAEKTETVMGPVRERKNNEDAA